MKEVKKEISKVINKTGIIVSIFILTLLISGVCYAADNLSLEQALQLGLENNTGLQTGMADQKKARIDLNSAHKAFLPQVDLQTSYTRAFLSEEQTSLNLPEDPGNPASQVLPYLAPYFEQMMPSEDNYQTTLSIQQPLYTGGKISNGLKQAKKGLTAANEQLKQQKSELLLQIIQSYYNVLLAQERVEIEKEALALVREQKKTVAASYKAGVTLKTDVLQVEIAEGKAVHSLAVAQNDLNTARKMLGNTIGTDLTAKELIWPELEVAVSLDEKEQYQLALANRPELKLLDINQQINRLNLRQEKNSHLPNIVLSGNYQWQGDKFSLENGTGSITLAASINIFDRGLASNKQKKTAEDIKKTELNKSNLKNMIKIELENLLQTIKEDKNNIKLQQLNLKKAEENLDLETKRYKVGMGTNVDVMNAQMTLKQTRIASMQAEYQYKINQFKLLQKTGQLTEYCQGVITNE